VLGSAKQKGCKYQLQACTGLSINQQYCKRALKHTIELVERQKQTQTTK